MNLVNRLKHSIGLSVPYTYHKDAVIISCFFNPMHSEYRLRAFKQWYKTIKHLNHFIVECTLDNAPSELSSIVKADSLDIINSNSMLWHKEALLMMAFQRTTQPYVFWVDADVLFTNPDWVVDGVSQLQSKMVVQLFEYCIHLEKDQIKPSFDVKEAKKSVSIPALRVKTIWRSFGANYVTTNLSGDTNYDKHGHVGFAWGARRAVLRLCPLYDKALIGGADHIIAHAAAGQIPHPCITNAFKDDLDSVIDWSRSFSRVVRCQLGYVKGDLYHLWHGDIDKRQYLKRVKDFTVKAKDITNKDKNGLYVATKDDDAYVRRYFASREVARQPVVARPSMSNVPVAPVQQTVVCQHDDSFLESMALGYVTDSTVAGGLMGGNFMGAYVGASLRDNSEKHNSVSPLAQINSPDSTPVIMDVAPDVSAASAAPDISAIPDTAVPDSSGVDSGLHIESSGVDSPPAESSGNFS